MCSCWQPQCTQYCWRISQGHLFVDFTQQKHPEFQTNKVKDEVFTLRTRDIHANPSKLTQIKVYFVNTPLMFRYYICSRCCAQSFWRNCYFWTCLTVFLKENNFTLSCLRVLDPKELLIRTGKIEVTNVSIVHIDVLNKDISGSEEEVFKCGHGVLGKKCDM